MENYISQKPGGNKLINEKNSLLLLDLLKESLGSKKPIGERLSEVVLKITQLLEIKGCLIRLYNPKAGTLDLKVSHGLSEKYLKKGPIDARRSLPEAMKGNLVVSYGVGNDERVQYRKEAVEEGVETAISAPMMLQGKVIGVMRLFRDNSRHLSEEELSLISTLAEQCAIAIENARQYENLKLDYESILEDTQRRTILEVRDLHKSFPGVEALRGVNFVLKEGDIHGLLGQNGAGKSTLIKILTGVYSSTKGRIMLDGKEIRIHNTQEARSFGFSTIYQDTNLVESMSIAENLMLGSLPTSGPFRFVDRKHIREMAIQLLTKVNLDVDPLIPIEKLTHGQKQMVMLAKLLGERKKIIILDEPTTALSSVEIKTFFRVLQDLKGKGLGIIYISHVLDEVFEICDFITVIRDGVNVTTKRTRELNKVEVARLMVGHETKERFETNTEISERSIMECIGLSNEKLAEPVNLKVRGGEIIGIIGARGSGEEDLVQLILGLGGRTEGKVLLESKDITGWGLNKRIDSGIGFIPSDRLKEGIFPNMSCMYNITLPVMSRHTRFGGLVNQPAMLRIANKFIKTFGIKATSPLQEVKSLSGGNQQKVLISKWFGAEAKAYLMCDITAGVDVGAKDEIYELIIKTAKEGSGIILVSHDLEEIFKVCHRIIVFHKGRIVFESPIASTDKREVIYYLMGGKDSNSSNNLGKNEN